MVGYASLHPPYDLLASIRQLGRFMNIAGLECKYFATSVVDARRYGELADSRFGDGPYTIVTTDIEDHLVPGRCRVIVDRGIEAVTIPTALLYALKPPTIIETE